ncbi:hypothetical protein MTR_2g437520 [Medicago truncatula]|uniref:Replication protein A 70 kDa DNA-binding subunit B/D first OB fold domain-containing protein n=1 Tax=Medicago truncatula TaxID=3880 RepID=A0A072VGQ4_MEDTR|nr:hypothetical protein MTR_2g437520 [Medicago truncatula]
MSSDYDYINDLKNDLDIWKIGFGVLDSWIVNGSNENQHMKLIICDAKGDRVHVITRYRELEHWKALIEENKTYTLFEAGHQPTSSGVEKFKTWKHIASLFGKQLNSIITSLDGIMKVASNHFPNEVSRTILKEKRKTITLIDDQTQRKYRKYKCRFITAERASYEIYLGGQWFNFSRELVMEEGGKLIFDLEKSSKNLHVRVVPK